MSNLLILCAFFRAFFRMDLDFLLFFRLDLALLNDASALVVCNCPLARSFKRCRIRFGPPVAGMDLLDYDNTLAFSTISYFFRG